MRELELELELVGKLELGLVVGLVCMMGLEQVRVDGKLGLAEGWDVELLVQEVGKLGLVEELVVGKPFHLVVEQELGLGQEGQGVLVELVLGSLVVVDLQSQ